MRILDQFLRDGDWLFRWRSYLPLAFVPVLMLGLVSTPPPFADHTVERLWEGLSVCVALSGLAIRIWAVGTAPSGTSERSTVNPRASELRTSGLYSVVRHPLYLANGLMALGLALFPGVWYLPLVTALATLLYYERIAAREEAFLEQRFGDVFRVWAARVPALVPTFRSYCRPSVPISLRKVLRHESHGLMVIAGGACILDLAQESLRFGRLSIDPIWLRAGMACAAVFIVTSAVKKTTSLLEIREQAPATSRQEP
jgi:protein-S-isoprenylcysteine O-methyltransferase Ste14